MVKRKHQEPEDLNKELESETTEYKEDTLHDHKKEGPDSGEDQKGTGAETEASSNEGGDIKADKKVNLEAQLLEKLAEMQDKYLRLSADFDNYRRRTLKEKMELTKLAGEEILIQILPVMDDFERAIKHMEAVENCAGMKEGIDIIYNKLSEFLKQQGIKEIEALNCDFNVDLHDAVTKLQVEDEKLKGKIVDVLLKGYYLKDKVIRHSKVVIGD